MSRLDRRTFLKGAGMLGASTALAGAGTRPAPRRQTHQSAAGSSSPTPSRTTSKFYNQKHGGQVKYEAIPWAQYHPTMETRAFAGEIVDVMYCPHGFRERWHENGLLRKVDDLPGVDELKKKMTPANLESLKNKDGSLSSCPTSRACSS